MTGHGIAPVARDGLPMAVSMTEQQIDLVKRTVCKNATDDELMLFIHQCNRTGLDPFSRQIHAVMRWDSKVGGEVMSIQVGIDGFRLIAQRSGEARGQTMREWCSHDGSWHDMWMASATREEMEERPVLRYPFAARVGVYREGFTEPLYGIAHWSEYRQTYYKQGKIQLSPMWAQMPANQLMKCAEAAALRAAFPMELSGLYTPEELVDESESGENNTDEAIDRPIIERDTTQGGP